MTKPVEFSSVFRLLNEAKEGEAGKSKELDSILAKYKKSEDSESALHQLGEVFLSVGIEELYNYGGSKSLEMIGCIDKEGWEDLAEKNKGELPPHLANTMIKFAKENNLAKKISSRWDMPARKLDQHIMQMARYITEGIIDAIE